METFVSNPYRYSTNNEVDHLACPDDYVSNPYRYSTNEISTVKKSYSVEGFKPL